MRKKPIADTNRDRTSTERGRCQGRRGVQQGTTRKLATSRECEKLDKRRDARLWVLPGSKRKQETPGDLGRRSRGDCNFPNIPGSDGCATSLLELDSSQGCIAGQRCPSAANAPAGCCAADSREPGARFRACGETAVLRRVVAGEPRQRIRAAPATAGHRGVCIKGSDCRGRHLIMPWTMDHGPEGAVQRGRSGISPHDVYLPQVIRMECRVNAVLSVGRSGNRPLPRWSATPPVDGWICPSSMVESCGPVGAKWKMAVISPHLATVRG